MRRTLAESTRSQPTAVRRLLAFGMAGAVLAACGSASIASSGDAAAFPHRSALPPAAARPVHSQPAGWQVLVSRHGRPTVAKQTAGVDGAAVTLIRFDTAGTRLVLHPGYSDPGGIGWPTHAAVKAAELPFLVAAFNGGFKLTEGQGGMAVGQRHAGRLLPGYASVVTYSDGTSDIGAWGSGIPAPGRSVASVRQNLHLLVSEGKVAPNINNLSAWGEMVFGSTIVARSALGIDKNHTLIWAGSASATPRALADALIRVGAQRALQLDINPTWVCAFAFGATGQVALMPGQTRPVGTYLAPWKRDFFTVDSR
jgi:hypothetical protein